MTKKYSIISLLPHCHCFSDKVQKVEKDPKKILVNLKEQEQKIRSLEESGDSKAKELKEKIAWKNVLQKAEGQKVKDDPNLLKKSIKKMVSSTDNVLVKYGIHTEIIFLFSFIVLIFFVIIITL